MKMEVKEISLFKERSYFIDKDYIEKIDDLDELVEYFKENILLVVTIKGLCINGDDISHIYRPMYISNAKFSNEIRKIGELTGSTFTDICDIYADRMEDAAYENYDIDFEYTTDINTTKIIGTYNEILDFLKNDYKTFDNWIFNKPDNLSPIKNSLDDFIENLSRG